jgi:hypothetical protein
MLYLIRGRDADKPPVVALLDSDEEGIAAAKLMRKDDAKMRRLVRKEFVLQIGEIEILEDASQKLIEIEDLIPESIALAAANAFLEELSQFRDSPTAKLHETELAAERVSGRQLFDALDAAAKKQGLHLDKIGFARAVIQQCKDRGRNSDLTNDVATFLGRMKKLFVAINGQRRAAERDNLRERVGSLVERLQRGFLRDHPNQATKDQALSCLENIQTTLDDSNEADAVRLRLNTLKRDFRLEENLNDHVPNYAQFSQHLATLKDTYAIDRIDAKV